VKILTIFLELVPANPIMDRREPTISNDIQMHTTGKPQKQHTKQALCEDFLHKSLKGNHMPNSRPNLYFDEKMNSGFS
jgi:hypothetical protein